VVTFIDTQAANEKLWHTELYQARINESNNTESKGNDFDVTEI
jgi:hypothetical protein